MKRFSIYFFLGLALMFGCASDDEDGVAPLDINMSEELPGYWKTTYLHADLVARVPPIAVSVIISHENVVGGVLFETDENGDLKAEFDVFSDMTITASLGPIKLYEESEDNVPIDNRLSYEIINNNFFRFYVNDSTDRPIEMFQYIAYEDLTFYAVEKSETYLDLVADVDVMNNFGELGEEMDELPEGDVPTTGKVYIRLEKVND
jgi:hypothetical protein